MKTLFYLTFFLLLPFTNGEPEEWRLKKSKDNIEIYTRSFPDSPFKEFKATSVIETTFDELFLKLIGVAHFNGDGRNFQIFSSTS